MFEDAADRRDFWHTVECAGLRSTVTRLFAGLPIGRLRAALKEALRG